MKRLLNQLDNFQGVHHVRGELERTANGPAIKVVSVPADRG